MSVDTFHDFSVVFYNYVIRLASDFNSLDMVFDRYFKETLKSQIRNERGSGGTRLLGISDDTSFPQNVQESFL